MGKHSKKDVIETIVYLCEYLDPDSLDQVWKKAYDLAQEKLQAKSAQEDTKEKDG